jgi:hypothetical protein
MTCLVSSAAPQPDDRQPNPAADGGLTLRMITSAIERLRRRWSGLGLDGAVFLAGEGLRSQLEDLRPAQRRDLLITIPGLCEQPRLCHELHTFFARGVLDPTASRSLPRLAATLQPVLAPTRRQTPLSVIERPTSLERPTNAAPGMKATPHLQESIERLGLTMRMENALRRHRFHRISDLVGLEEAQLLCLHNIGSGGVQDLRAGLERLGLPFPLRLDSSSDVIPPAPLSPTGTNGGAAEQRWVERANALIGNASAELPGAQRRLEELISLTLEHFNSLAHRCEELHQLRFVCQAIATAGTRDDQHRWLAEGLQGAVLRGYGACLETEGLSRLWLRKLLKTVKTTPAVVWFLSRAAGETLEAISTSTNPPRPRDAVRLSLRRFSGCVGVTPEELAVSVDARQKREQAEQQLEAVKPWLRTLGRLPFDGDDLRTITAHGDWSAAMRLEEVIRLDLNQRLELYARLAITVPDKEWALHLRVIANHGGSVGPGYWKRQDALREFLHRFAVVLGAPGRMPKQTQLPISVRSAVQRYGGQSAVARAFDLAYQGQLVGESGRTYWTRARLRTLLEQTAEHNGLPARAMPSRTQITAFMKSGVVSDYDNKRPGSVFAALTRKSTLSWPRVAKRFARIWPSQPTAT